MLDWTNNITKDEIAILSKAIILNALLELSKRRNLASIYKWLKSDRFEITCGAANLNSSWIRKIFYQVDSLEGANRKAIAKRIKNIIINNISIDDNTQDEYI